MRAHEIREFGDQDLRKELENSHKELMNLRFRLATKQVSNTSQPRVVKKNIARIHTIMRERQMGAR